MNKDTENFLETLLWVADDPGGETRPFEGMTIHQFAPEMITGAEAFCAGFRAHLEKTGFDMASFDRLERSFGGNCYFSLSGHGVGFFDECDDALSDLQDVIQTWAGHRRFEELANMLEVNESGKIDIGIIPEAIKEYRDRYFAVPA
jgi:hypothetical protein